MALTVALLGAESTGKTTLAHQLASALRASGRRVAVVPEVLRSWCERERRTPRPEDHLPIAQEQEQLADAAAASHDVVIADTTASMVLVYSGIMFEDHPLYRFALARQRAYGLTLLCGLDLPWTPDGLHRESAAVRAQVDAQLRELLHRHAMAYRVVYGLGEQRVGQALAAIEERLGQRRAQPAPRWTGRCETCSDPDCERRLFAMLREPPTAPTT